MAGRSVWCTEGAAAGSLRAVVGSRPRKDTYERPKTGAEATDENKSYSEHRG